MNKEIVTMPSKILAGITARTSNELEFNPQTNQIGKTFVKYCAQDQAVLHSLVETNKANLYALYTEYESNEHGPYTFFVGQEIKSAERVDELRKAGLHVYHTREQKYAKFVSETGPMPDVCIALWQKIWSLSEQDLGGKRSYGTDFEIYHTDSFNPTSASVEIYIGIEA